MPRIRTIKPEFFSSPDTARASFPARLMFIALWCWADDWGIGETNINGLLGMAFHDEDGMDRERLLELLAEVRDVYGVTFYTVKGRHFYEIPSWDEHQRTERRANRRYPLPDDPESGPDLRLPESVGTSASTQGNSVRSDGDSTVGKGKGKGNITTHLSTELAVVEGGVGGEVKTTAPAKAVARTRGSRLPDNWFPSDDTVALMRQEFPTVTPQEWKSEHAQFCDYWLSQSGARGTKADWDATWRNWMRREFRKDQYSRRVTGNGQRLSTVDQKIVNLQAMKEPE